MAIASKAADAAPTAEQVDALVRDFEALNQALSRSRQIRLIFLVLAVLLVGASTYAFYELANKFSGQENREKLLEVAQSRLSQRSDFYMKEVEKLVTKSTPVLTEAFSKQAKNDLKKYMTGVGKERDEFVAKLGTRVQATLDKHSQALLDKHQAILAKEFPVANDPEVKKRVVANLHAVFEKMVKKYYADELNGQMVKLYDSFDQFPAAPRPAAGDPSVEDQFIACLIDLLKLRLTEADAGAALKH